MDERKDPPPPEDSAPRAVAAASRLSPIQQAWGDYVDHATRCPICRSVDGGRCDDAERLHHAYEAEGKTAYRRLGNT